MMTGILIFCSIVLGVVVGYMLAILRYEDRVAAMDKQVRFWQDVAERQKNQIMGKVPPELPPPIKWNGPSI